MPPPSVPEPARLCRFANHVTALYLFMSSVAQETRVVRAAAQRLRVPISDLRERVAIPGERSFCSAVADGFREPVRECPWAWVQARPRYAESLIDIFMSTYVDASSSDATLWQRRARRCELHELMLFDGEGRCQLRSLVELWGTAHSTRELWRMCAPLRSTGPPPRRR